MTDDLRARMLIVLSRHGIRIADRERMQRLLDDLCEAAMTGDARERKSLPDWQPRHKGRQAREKNPAPGMRICATCKQTLPLDAFGTNVHHGRRVPRTSCRACLTDKQRNRYISARKIKAFNTLRLEVVADDEIAGLRCLDCGTVIRVGDELVCESGVRHAQCAAQEATA